MSTPLLETVRTIKKSEREEFDDGRCTLKRLGDVCSKTATDAVLRIASITASILLAFSRAAADSWWSNDRPSIRAITLTHRETYSLRVRLAPDWHCGSAWLTLRQHLADTEAALTCQWIWIWSPATEQSVSRARAPSPSDRPWPGRRRSSRLTVWAYTTSTPTAAWSKRIHTNFNNTSHNNTERLYSCRMYHGLLAVVRVDAGQTELQDGYDV